MTLQHLLCAPDNAAGAMGTTALTTWHKEVQMELGPHMALLNQTVHFPP